MKTMTRFAAVAALAVSMSGTYLLAQQDQSNQVGRQEAVQQAQMDKNASKADVKANKAQMKADEKQKKLMKSDKAKDAAKAQDKANEKAEKASQYPPN